MNFFYVKLFWAVITFCGVYTSANAQCLNINATPTDVTCFDGNDGQIAVKINAGVGPFRVDLFYDDGGLTWLGSVNTPIKTTITFAKGNGTLNQPLAETFGIPSNSGITQYIITVVASGPGTVICERKTTVVTVGAPPELLATVNSITPACTPGTGAINLDVSGGTTITPPPNYNYAWTPSLPNVEDPTGLNGGSYDVIVSDQNNCKVTLTGIVVVSTPTITLGSNPSVCIGTINSSISYSATTQTPTQYSIDWTSGLADVGLTALPVSPIPINGIPVAPGTYNGTLFVSNASCVSVGYPVSITVNPLPVVSVPFATLCVGATMTASPGAGGTWVSSAPAIATISNAGLITGISAGTVTFTFTSTTTGCINTTPTVTVNALPVVSTPSAILCVGATINASPGVGGTWVSNAPGVATINNAGLVTGISAGTVTFTFTSTATGCSDTTPTVTVNALPVVSTPSATLCVGATMNASPGVGGTWVSSAPGVATINNAGLVTGISGGTVTFTFTSTATGCSNTTPTVTVNALPVVSTPATTLCVGATLTASPGVGGTWVSSAPAVATISNAGLVTGISAGTVTFTFTETLTGCSNTTPTVTVNALPVVSTPSATLCVGATMTASPGIVGTWVSSAPAVATISNTGLVTGISAGIVTFTFTETATGCSNTTSNITVNPLPMVSTPFATLCVGATMTASPGVGGIWVSSAPAVATISNTGLVTGISEGAVTFTFTETVTGCSATTPLVTVNALPVVSTPSATLCVGATMTASPGVGGSWVSSAPAVATISNAGLITGISAGIVTFTFTETLTGCSNTTPTVTVNALPIVSTSSATLCVGATMTASPGVGGSWVSSAPAVATISNAGLVTGISGGAVTFTFTETATGCSNTTSSITVNALPVVSTPSATLCVGATMTASPGVGGAWVSSAPAVATISNAGLITGISAGIVTFTFTETATGCSNTTSNITVNPLPMVSTPFATLCVGATMTASPGTGGTWVSSAPAVATISNTGLVTGISAGTVTFTYTDTATGCNNTTSTVAVSPVPTVNISSIALCVGATVIASPGVGGTWISSAPAIATINNAGLVTGIAAGTVTFTFTETATGCGATTSIVTVNALPVVSTPSATLCVGATMTASPGSGGTWVSSAPAVATIDNAGLIAGISAGSATFTFTETSTGCSAATSTVTVNTTPTVSVPSATLCIGATISASPGTGGTWVSNTPSVAIIDNAGLVTGISAGTSTFTFTETATGCSAITSTVTVTPLPAVSIPLGTLCIGATMNASPGTGGAWISNTPSVATIDNTGLITGITAGNVTFTVTETATGCSATTSTITINSLPTVSTSSVTLCVGSTLNGSPGTGGTWISSAPAIATIDNAGLITGISAGTVTFTFTETATGCSATTSNVTVNTAPTVSVSSATLCIGSTISASPGVGGAWVSSDPTVATIDNTGLVTSVSAGTITFTFIETATGCSSTTSTVTVNALPIVTTPSATLCIGTTMTASPASGGTWVSSTPGVASIDNAGLITGVSAGTVTFTFTETLTGCSSTTSLITVENTPNQSLAIGATINPVCSGGVSDVTIANSEIGVNYQLRNDADDSSIGGPVTGTGATIQISTDILTSTTTFNVLAARGSCIVELNNTITINVSGLINGSIAVAPLDNAVCDGTGTQINVSNSEVGVNYQLRNDADDSTIGVAIAGTGGTISLPANNLTTTTTFNIIASNGACSIELTNQVTVNVDINPDPSLAVAATISPLCVGGSTTIAIVNSEVGVNYQLRDNSDNSLIGSAVGGTGLTVELPTGVLNASITYNVLAFGGVCTPVQLSTTATVTVSGSIDLSLPAGAELSPICSGSNTNIQISTSEVGVDYQLIDDSSNSIIGGIVPGNGGLINLPTGTLSASSLFKVLVANGSCSAELTSKANVVVNTLPSIGLPVNPQNPSVCSGTSSFIQIDNSEAGVIYQLRDDADDSIVSGAVIGNGNTINLPTGILMLAKTFNVLAGNGACSIQLTSTPSISIDAAPLPTPSVIAQDAQICAGKGTFIQVLNSEPGIIYQLRDNADNSNVSGATFGNGGTINLPTGPINTDRTFNVLASNMLCSVQLSIVVTVTLRATNDPLCSNCSAVVVSTINPIKVTCGATVPDGSITFQIEPPVPVVNIIGVKIQITGPTPKTQTNDFVFTGLAVGNYTYTVTYGDENNPDCIKTGSFIIELSREPDPISFDLSVDEYDCLVNEGSVTLGNITGASDTDFDFTIFSNGATLTQGVILKSSTATFNIENLLLGDYEIQLSQNQQAVNGCLGIVNSQRIDFSIAEPSGGCPVIIPNIFTPNGDGSNDFFEIRNLPASSTLSITNRWGKEVYSSSDYQNNWTAENISDGIYYYRLVAEGEAMTGWVEILR